MEARAHADAQNPGRVSRILVGITLTEAAAVLAIAAVVTVSLGIPFSFVSADIAQIGQVSPFAGFLSTLGVLVWWASASIWIFTAVLSWSRGELRFFWFALTSGLLSTYLALDDMFEVHEVLASRVAGVSEKVVYALLLVVLVAYVVGFRDVIRARASGLLIAALVMFAGSIGVDAFHELLPTLHIYGLGFLEDGLKWMGIACWLSFCLVRCYTQLATPGPVERIAGRENMST